MVIKRAAALLAFTLAVCLLLSACDIKIPLIKEETTDASQTATETTTAPPDYAAYYRAYGEYMISVINSGKNLAGYTYDTEGCLFTIEDLDENGVPELLISEDDKQASKVDICSYDGYDVFYIGSVGEYGGFEYCAPEKKLYVDSDSAGQRNYTVYSFDSSVLTLVWEGTAVEDEENGTLYYTGDGTQPVDEEEFNAQLAANVPEESVTIGRNGYPLTEANARLVMTGSEMRLEGGDTQEADSEKLAEMFGEKAPLYRDFLIKKAMDEAGADAAFTFRFIDSDDVPELVVFQGSSSSSAAEIYTLDGEEVRLLCTAGSGGSVYCGNKNSMITGIYSSEDTENVIAYEKDGASVTTLWTGEAVFDSDTGSISECTSDGETVTAGEYRELKDSYTSAESFTLVSVGDDTSVELSENSVKELFD